MKTSSLRSPVVRQAVDAINQGMLDDFMALFAPDAAVIDGATYQGLQDIRKWAQRETFGVQTRFHVESENAEGTAVTGNVQSVGGYSGPATLTFTVRNDKIERLAIS